MTEENKWFTRYGQPYSGQKPVHVIDEDRASFVQKKVCHRCGGAGGSEAWRFTGWTCYECGGAGHLGNEVVKLYTLDKIQKMDATREKRRATAQAKREREAAAAELERQKNLAATHAKMEEMYPDAVKILRGTVTGPFLLDIQSKFNGGHELSERQADAVVRVHEQMIERSARDTIIDKWSAIGHPDPVEPSRVQVRAALIAHKIQDSQWGTTIKALWITDQGLKLWGTMPQGVTDGDRGNIFTFKATLEPSNNDAGFAFYKRPSKAATTK